MSEFEMITPHFTYVADRFCTPSWRLGPHVHHVWNLTYVCAGEAFYQCNDETCTVTSGHLICNRPGDFRQARTSDSNPMHCFAVDFLYTCPVLRPEGWQLEQPSLPFPTFSVVPDPLLRNRLEVIFGRLSQTWLVRSPHVQSQCHAVFIELLNLLLDMHKPSASTFDQRRRVHLVTSYMADHYQEKLQLCTLAQVADVSISYLGHMFRSVLQKSPVGVLMEIRIAKACQLLSEGHSVSEVAQLCGFRDVFYFSRYFKKAVGMAPSRYAAQP